MTDRRKTAAITAGVVVVAAVVIFLIVQALTGTDSYDSADELMTRLEAEGFEIGESERPSAPIEVPGATHVFMRGRGYQGTGWVTVSDGSLDAVKRAFDDSPVSVVEGTNWVFAVVDDTLEAERTEGLAREVADILGGEVVAA